MHDALHKSDLVKLLYSRQAKKSPKMNRTNFIDCYQYVSFGRETLKIRINFQLLTLNDSETVL